MDHQSGTLAQVKSVTSLFLLALLVGGFSPQLQASDLVRVEIIVFHHADGRPDRWPSAGDDTFAALPDPLALARLAAWTARLMDDAALTEDTDDLPDLPGPYALDQLTLMATESATDADGLASPLRVNDGREPSPLWPTHHVGLGNLSSSMQRALDRLGRSDDYQVLTATAWLQPLSRLTVTPPVRIRGIEALHVYWGELEADNLEIHGPIEAPRGQPRADYRLDGSLQLRQRQFRHADLDLVWRELVDTDEGAELKLHRLNQSRPIRFGRLEYFDSAWLGALVLVDTWERPAIAAPAAPASQP